MEKDAYWDKMAGQILWEDFPCGLVLVFSVSPEHPHYFLFPKSHGKEEEILRPIWAGNFKVP